MEESTWVLLVGALNCGQGTRCELLEAGAEQGLTQPGCCSPGLPWLSATSMEVMSPLLISETFSPFSPQDSTWVTSQKIRGWISAVTFLGETFGNEAMECEGADWQMMSSCASFWFC